MMSDNLRLGYLKAADGTPLYAAFHAASTLPLADGTIRNAQSAIRNLAPVVIAPPLFEERKSAYGPLRRLAEKLAHAGHPVLRFDYRGTGESGGDPAQRRWQHMVEDLATALQALAELSGESRCVLLGLRLGATLALRTASACTAGVPPALRFPSPPRGRGVRGEGAIGDPPASPLQSAPAPDLAGIIALAPIVSGSAQVRLWKMRSKIRSELTADAARADAQSKIQNPKSKIDLDGFPVNPAIFDDVAAIDLTKELAPLSCPSLLMQLSHRQDAAPETTALMSKMGERAKLICLRMEPFWDKLDDVNTQPVEDAVITAVSGF
ncbi:MAG TPA: alpha/beta fold hydrolase [Planctomycetota bacterium]|jgi:pimeloyl-ACP methyl ester carboxylesterase